MDFLDNEYLTQYIDSLVEEINEGTVPALDAMWRVVGYVTQLAEQEMRKREAL